MYISSEGRTSDKILKIPLWSIDIIPSAIMDTILLPKDYAEARKARNSNRELEPPSLDAK
jgi:uncharacterized protein YceK